MTSEYTFSHTGEGKGRSYDHEFSESRFLKYLWEREQTLLRLLLSKEQGRLKPGGTLRYLDFACGTGRILSALESLSDSSVGVDVSPAMMVEARRKTCRSELVLGNVLEQPELVLGPFEVATAFRFFPNADPDLRKMTAEFLGSRVIGSGLLIVNNHQNAASLLCRLGRALGKEWPWTPLHNDELIRLISSAGFRLEGTRGLGMLPGTSRRAYAPDWLHAAADRLSNHLGMGRLAQDVIMWFRRV